MTDDAMRRAHLRVYGRVQGVYFRASTKQQADALGLSGWVRNRRDGTVELVVEGPLPAVESLCRWAASGPPMAQVDLLEREDSDPVGPGDGFVVRPTV